jgi:hypothetical protein
MSIRQKFNKYSLIINLFSLIFLLIPACKKDLSPVKLVQEKEIEIKLTVESAEVTEAWLKLETSPLESEAVYIVKRDTNFVFNGKLDKSDTLLHDENLQPAHEYNYSAYAILNGKTGRIVKASLTTMDTTSHDFEWEVFEFGAKSSSILRDVAIINENDIWAVGEIYTEDSYTYDSLGNWIEPYNAVHWDGEKWELKRILYKGGFWDIHTVFAFNENDIWFEAFVKWNGIKFIQMPIPDILIGHGINKIWGISGNDLFIVGNNGLIAHYDGQSWQKIESGTDIDLTDIWGYKNEIWICGWQNDARSILFKVKDGNVETIWLNSQPKPPYVYKGLLSTLWSSGKSGFFLSGNGYFYWHSIYNPSYIKRHFIDFGNFIYRLRGDNINDVILVGDRSSIWHWNGSNWRHYSEYYYPSNRLYSVDYKNRLFTAIGYSYNTGPFRKALIIIGKRN